MANLIGRAARGVAAALPPGAIRFLGRLQFRLPVIGPLIGRFGRGVLAGEGTIRHGVGAGLRIDATGMNPGFLLGTTDPHEQAALARYLKPGNVFYDVGANVGFFCLLAARLVGPAGRVYAFEPHPAYAERVRKNARLNGFAIQVVEAAVADSSGETVLRVDGVNCPSIVQGAGDGIPVRVVAIDDLVAHGEMLPPAYVVIDAEGAEILVLRGMAETLRRHRPVVLCEVHWLGREFTDYVAAHLQPLGYALMTLDGKTLPVEPARYHALLTPAERC
jgi:FkbM family methyltransferase